jgi:molybdenum cofactor synthesis domain-containing protein
MPDIRIGVITCSDTRSAGSAQDTAGPTLAHACADRGWTVIGPVVIPDDRASIAAEIVRMADTERCDIVLTTGGTGFGPRDVTPEATFDVCERPAPGIAEAIRAGSMAVTRRAMLSRGAAALRGHTLVINFPGSRKAAAESLEFVIDQFEHAVSMMAGGGHS